MKINAINSVYQNHRISGVKTKASQSDNYSYSNNASSVPAFKGDLGRGIGSVAGFLTVAAGFAVFSALSIAFPIAPLVAAGVATKAFGDAGSKIEDDINNKNKPR